MSTYSTSTATSSNQNQQVPLSSTSATTSTPWSTTTSLSSHLTSFNLNEIPQLHQLKSLYNLLEHRKVAVDTRKLNLIEQQPEKTTETDTEHVLLPSSISSSTSATLQSYPQSIPKSSIHTDHQPAPIFISPQIIRVKREDSVGDAQFHTPTLLASSPSSSPDPLKLASKRKKSTASKKKRKRNGSESVLSASDRGEMTSERDSPEVPLRRNNLKIRKLDSTTYLSQASLMGTVSQTESPEPPLPALPPPPLPPSAPPPLPTTGCPPLPSGAPPPLPMPIPNLVVSTSPSVSLTTIPTNSPQADLPLPPTQTLVHPSAGALVDYVGSAGSPEIPTPPRISLSPSPSIQPSLPPPSSSSNPGMVLPPPLPILITTAEVPENDSAQSLIVQFTHEASQTASSDESIPLALADPPEVPQMTLPSMAELAQSPLSRSPSANGIPSPSLKVKEKDTLELPPPSKPKKRRLRFGTSPTSCLPNPISSTIPTSVSILTPTASTSIHTKPLHQSLTASRCNTPTAEQPPQQYTDDFRIPNKCFVPSPIPFPSLPAYPKSQGEVNTDFSKTKVTGTQVPISQFQTWVHDNYLRSYGEDDLAYLSNKEDDQWAYDVPCLGTHYSEVWKTEDSGTPMSMKADEEVGGRGEKKLQRIKREEIHDGCFRNESLESGPLTERLLGSLQALKKLKHTSSVQIQPLNSEEVKGNGGDKDVKMNEGNVNEKVVEAFKEMDPMDVEAKLLKELRYVGLLEDDEEVDWSKREDDEISIALRLTQTTFKKQIETNENRKNRLTEIVKLRMAYQEYETLKDGLDRVIELAWTKRLKRKDNANVSGSGGSSINGTGVKVAIENRNAFLVEFRSLFEGIENRMPEKSIYA